MLGLSLLLKVATDQRQLLIMQTPTVENSNPRVQGKAHSPKCGIFLIRPISKPKSTRAYSRQDDGGGIPYGAFRVGITLKSTEDISFEGRAAWYITLRGREVSSLKKGSPVFTLACRMDRAVVEC